MALNRKKPSFLPNKPLTSMRPYAEKGTKGQQQPQRPKNQRRFSQMNGEASDGDVDSSTSSTPHTHGKPSSGAVAASDHRHQDRASKDEVAGVDGPTSLSSQLHDWVRRSASYTEAAGNGPESRGTDGQSGSSYALQGSSLPRRLQGAQYHSSLDGQRQQQHINSTAADDNLYQRGTESSAMPPTFLSSAHGLSSSPLPFASVNLHPAEIAAQSSYFLSSTPSDGQARGSHLGEHHFLSPPLRPSPMVAQTMPFKSASSGDLTGPSMRAMTSNAAWATCCPSTTLASAAHLANMGVGIGPGVNPNVSTTGSSAMRSSSAQNNPPIVNTGNNGPMCVQPGDWVCSSCGFVNWRRRRVCMRCFPFVDANEMSHSIANGAALAAQLAAGLDPSPEALTSLAQPRKQKADAVNGHNHRATSSQAGTPLLGSASGLPPRPDHRPLQSNTLLSSPDIFHRRAHDASYQLSQASIEETMNRALSLCDTKASSAFPASCYSAYQAPFVPPTSAPSPIARSPSMPVLHPSSNAASAAGRNIWTGMPSGMTATCQQPMSMSTAGATPLPSAYRTYKPKMFQADSHYTSSTLPPPLLNDEWDRSLSQQPGQHDNSKPHSNDAIYHGYTLDDDAWLSLHTPFTASSSSTVKLGAQQQQQQEGNPTVARPTLHGIKRSTDSHADDDASVSTPGLCKSKAVIQPPLPPPATATNTSIGSQPNKSKSSASSTENLSRALQDIPSILLSITSSSD